MKQPRQADETAHLQKKIRQLRTFLEASTKLTSTFDLKMLISDILSTAVEALEIENCSLWLLNEEKGELVVDVSVGELGGEGFQYSLKLGEGVAGKVAQSGEPCLIEGSKEEGSRAMLCVPLRSRPIRGLDEKIDAEIVGVIELLHREGQTFSKEDMELIEAFASLAAVAINNQRLFEEVEDALYTVQSLASALDIKDSVTFEHSRRVAELALAIYEEMEGIPDERRYLELASLLHDVGKIGIRQEVLDKPGSLTEAEFQHMQEHPDIGHQLIKKHRFLRRIIPSVLYNQERYDGKGYPQGLKGEEIPISARIIAVADAFDAMTNDRPYRKAMAIQEALDEIVGNAGTQFDPKVVSAFLRAMEKGKVKPSRREGEMYYVEKDD